MTEEEKRLKQQVESGNVSDESYQQAVNSYTSQQPTYAATYDKQLNDIYSQIMNRDKFSYDLNADMLYDQYKNQYMDMGKLAMKDTMGQAAALTGGYGSSYAQSVGQQQYDAYLKQLNDVVPSLYGMALDQYNSEGNRLAEQYALTGDLAANEYAKYQDSLNQYWQNRDYAYNNLMNLISSTGYKPSAEEIAAAGLTQEQVDLILKTWQLQNPDLAYKTGGVNPEEYRELTGYYPAGYSTGGGGDYSGWDGKHYSYSQSTHDLQVLLNNNGYNLAEDGYLGDKTEEAYDKFANTLEGEKILKENGFWVK